MFVRTIHQAKSQLSKLIQQVVDGEEIIIGKAGKPLVKLVALADGLPHPKRKFGALKGKIKILEGFDEIPPEFVLAMNQTIDEDLD